MINVRFCDIIVALKIEYILLVPDRSYFLVVVKYVFLFGHLFVAVTSENVTFHFNGTTKNHLHQNNF